MASVLSPEISAAAYFKLAVRAWFELPLGRTRARAKGVRGDKIGVITWMTFGGSMILPLLLGSFFAQIAPPAIGQISINASSMP
jgi:hypothetical protein